MSDLDILNEFLIGVAAADVGFRPKVRALRRFLKSLESKKREYEN